LPCSLRHPEPAAAPHVGQGCDMTSRACALVICTGRFSWVGR
jgi:hypothetical protein